MNTLSEKMPPTQDSNHRPLAWSPGLRSVYFTNGYLFSLPNIKYNKHLDSI